MNDLERTLIEETGSYRCIQILIFCIQKQGLEWTLEKMREVAGKVRKEIPDDPKIEGLISDFFNRMEIMGMIDRRIKN